MNGWPRGHGLTATVHAEATVCTHGTPWPGGRVPTPPGSLRAGTGEPPSRCTGEDTAGVGGGSGWPGSALSLRPPLAPAPRQV